MQRRAIALTSMLALVLVFSGTALAQYQLRNLSSNQVKQARNDDPLNVNAWGLARGATTPWWVADQGSGWSTLYNETGVRQGLVVSVPPAKNSFVGQPTGLVFNGSPEFKVDGSPAIFIFDTLDGTISAWAPGANLKSAIVIADNSADGASYTALAISSKPSGNFLYAVDNAHNRVDIYDGTFTWTGSFAADPNVPSGMAAFGIRDINGTVFVAYAPVDEGPGGYIDMYHEDGSLIGMFAQGRPLNQPWGFALAPKNFGPLSNTLLISNNNNAGTIVAYTIKSNGTGEFAGVLKDASGHPLVINQLWAIDFGGGNSTNGAANQLFFTAGPNNNLAGTFGSIVFK